MNWVNYDDVIAQMQSYDLVIDTRKFKADVDKPIRCDIKGSLKKSEGWYWLHTFNIDGESLLVGTFGFWQGEDQHTQKVELTKSCKNCGQSNTFKAKKCTSCGKSTFDKKEFTPEQKKALAAQRKEAQKKAEFEQKRKNDNASALATTAFGLLSKTGECDYLQSKLIDAPAGIRYGTGELITVDSTDDFGKSIVVEVPNDTNSIAIPLMDNMSRIYGLQFIRGKGSKKLNKQFWPADLKVKASFFKIGAPTQIILIAEGFATAMTLHTATGYQVYVAFNANNIEPVAEVIKKANPRANILICADDDYMVFCPAKLGEKKTRCNHPSLAGADQCPSCGNNLFYMRDGKKIHMGKAGEKAAEAAAVALGVAWIKPVFPSDRQLKKLTDFNDLANFEGCNKDTVAQQIDDKIISLGWEMEPGPQTFGEGVILQGGGGERQSAVSIMSLDNAVVRFVPLDDGTGKYVFDCWTNKVVLKDQMISLLPAGVRGDDIKRHYLWQSRGAFYLDQIGFDPTGKDKKVKLNTFSGWEMKPKQGACEKILEIVEFVCSKEEKSDEALWFLLRWMAYPLQNPGAKMLSAVILHGPQGTGKSFVFKVLADIYGKYGTVIGNRAIEDKFNADWADSKLFVLAEEIATSSDKWNINDEMKELITGPTVRVRPMHMTAYHQKNQMNFALLSNHDMPIPIDNDDRRHLVIYTPPSLPESHYLDAMRERDNGGTEAFYDFLMNLDLTGFDRYTKPPSTHAKDNLISVSLSSDKRFIKEWMAGDTKWPCVPCLSTDLYSAYLKWCKENGEPRPRPSNQFIGMIGNMHGWLAGGKEAKKFVLDNLNDTNGGVQRRLVIPPQLIKNQHGEFTSLYAEKKESETLLKWISNFVFDFKNANSSDSNHE